MSEKCQQNAEDKKSHKWKKALICVAFFSLLFLIAYIGHFTNAYIVSAEEREIGEDGQTEEIDITDTEQEAMENVDLAYCITIHKSQGAEFPCVIIPLLKEHYIMLRRNLLYTAISRAKGKVIIVGQRQAVYMAIHKSDVDKRNTVLADRIVAYYDRETRRRAV